MSIRRIAPSFLINLEEELGNKTILSMSIGFDRQIYFLLTVQNGYPSIPKKRFVLQTGGTYTYMQELDIDKGYFVQPFNNKDWLVVVSRTQGADNAYVLDKNGKFKRSFLVGDAIANVQLTQNNQIWISYRDEGYFNNINLLNSSGGVASLWNDKGELEYILDLWLDCYAMNNVSHNETWFYTHPDFPLVQVIDNKPKRRWKSSVSGADAIALWDKYILATVH